MEISDEQIEALYKEAIKAGDLSMQATCIAALLEDSESREECAKAIAWAKGQVDHG
jgi:hypothetical protein